MLCVDLFIWQSNICFLLLYDVDDVSKAGDQGEIIPYNFYPVCCANLKQRVKIICITFVMIVIIFIQKNFVFGKYKVSFSLTFPYFLINNNNGFLSFCKEWFKKYKSENQYYKNCYYPKKRSQFCHHTTRCHFLNSVSIKEIIKSLKRFFIASKIPQP